MNYKIFTKAFVAASIVLSGVSIAVAAEPIRIGAVLSVTGPASYLGDPELKTLQIYIDKINTDGGVIGRKIELVHYDDGTAAAKANSFAKRLIESDGVDAIIGGTTTGATMAMVPLVEKAGIPFVSLAGAIVVIDPVKKWVFKTPHTDRMAAEKVFEDMKKRGITKIGLLSDTGGFGKSGHKEAKNVIDNYGITLVADETYNPTDTDMTAQLTKIKGAPGVQAIFVFGFGQGAAIVTKNYGQLGIDIPLYQSHGVASDEYVRLSGEAAEGVRMPTPAVLLANELPGNDPQKPVVVEYNETYRSAYKSDPSTFGGYAYDALALIVDAIKRADSVDKHKVRSALEQTKGLIGATGEFNMSPTDHMGLDLTAFRMAEVRNGAWKLLD
ncbi:MAG: ABC transporter substrate-binding protein [Burkholderiaceae bacterium]